MAGIEHGSAGIEHGPAGVERVAIVDTLRAAGCVFAEAEADVLISSATTPRHLRAMVERRAGGDPLEFVLGWAEFCGLRVAIEPGLFVPRHRTELLVRLAASVAPPGASVVDLCCGTGAVGAAIAAIVDRVRLVAADIDPAAVRCARRNLSGLSAEVFEGDLFAALPSGLRGRVDVLVANVPYVPSSEIALLPAEARTYEPRQALDGGPDGLDLFRRVAGDAAFWLARAGHVLMETGVGQAAAARDAMVRGGLTAQVVHSDDLDATVILGSLGERQRPPNASRRPE